MDISGHTKLALRKCGIKFEELNKLLENESGFYKLYNSKGVGNKALHEIYEIYDLHSKFGKSYDELITECTCYIVKSRDKYYQDVDLHNWTDCKSDAKIFESREDAMKVVSSWRGLKTNLQIIPIKRFRD